MQIVNELIEQYIDAHSESEDSILKSLYRETQLKVLMPHMCSGHVQGQLLYMLTKLSNARNVLEIGTFTGYATICFARGIQEAGLVDTIDINKELSDLCMKYFSLAALEHKIKMHIGNAQAIIPILNKKYDIIFIDADKQNYCLYYELIFDMLNPGGLIIADNVLWKGEVISEKKSKDAEAMHQYNLLVQNDTRVESIILSIRDGLNIVRKK